MPGPLGEFELVLGAQAELGEGPMWDPRLSVLVWVDIYKAAMHFFDPETGNDTSIRLPSPCGAVAMRASGGYIAALADGVFAVALETGAVKPLAMLSDWNDAVRFNDGKCDPQGRFWAGTITLPRGKGISGSPSDFRPTGTLFFLDSAVKLHAVIHDVAVSNGLGWSPDGRKFYYIDSAEHGVDSFDFYGSSGTVANRRRLVQLDDSSTPDGMTVDAEGGLWVALHGVGGSYLNRYAPDGSLDREIPAPFPGITSCAFGGPDLDQLFVTTRRSGVDRVLLSKVAHQAGGIFCFRPGVKGMPIGAFAG
jgi:sugar lactone lactonase YvrE